MTEKKGLSPWAWVAIGCGGLLVVCAIIVSVSGFFVAKKVGDFAEDFTGVCGANSLYLVAIDTKFNGLGNHAGIGIGGR